MLVFKSTASGKSFSTEHFELPVHSVGSAQRIENASGLEVVKASVKRRLNVTWGILKQRNEEAAVSSVSVMIFSLKF